VITDDARLAAAVKSDDAFFPTYFVSPYSKHIARWCARHGLTPNVVSCASFAVGIGAAVAFAVGDRAGLVAGAVLLQASFVLDCVDGQLARYAGLTSEFGGWLDSVFDRAKEYLVYAGLAYGSLRVAHDDVWDLAAAALALQTWRHLMDFSFAAGTGSRPDAGDGGPAAAVAAMSRRTDEREWLRWPKRILVLPIGERLLLISVTAAVFRPAVTFVALLAWGGLAALYATVGRVLRSVP